MTNCFVFVFTEHFSFLEVVMIDILEISAITGKPADNPKCVAPCLQGVLASLSSEFSRAAATVLFRFTSLAALF